MKQVYVSNNKNELLLHKLPLLSHSLQPTSLCVWELSIRSCSIALKGDTPLFFNSVKMEEQYTDGLWCDKYFPALSDCLRPSLSPDSPRSFWWYHLTCWLLSAVGVVCILVAHEHYSVDVVVAYFITSRLFWWYHTMANLQVWCGLYCPSINIHDR